MSELRSPRNNSSAEVDYSYWFDYAESEWGAVPLSSLGQFIPNQYYLDSIPTEVDLDTFEKTAVIIDLDRAPKNAWKALFVKIIAYCTDNVNTYNPGEIGGHVGHIGITPEGAILNVREGRNSRLGHVKVGANNHFSPVKTHHVNKEKAIKYMTEILSNYDKKESIMALKQLRGYSDELARIMVENHNIAASLTDKSTYVNKERFRIPHPHVLIPLKELDENGVLRITGAQYRQYGKNIPRYLFLKQVTPTGSREANILETPKFSIIEPARKNLNEDMIAITEGPLKAILIAETWGYRTISAQGIQHMENYQKLGSLLRKFNCNRVALIPDRDIMDKEKHAIHAQNLVLSAIKLDDQDITPTFITWPDRRYKGIDDAILKGDVQFIEQRFSTWFKGLPKRSKNYLSRKGVNFQMKVQEYYLKDELALREEFSSKKLIDGDIEDAAITNARKQIATKEEIWKKVEEISLSKTMVLELPTGSGKSYQFGGYLNAPPKSWDKFKQILYIPHNIYEESVDSLKAIPQYQGRSSTGRKRSSDGQVSKVSPGEQADSDLKANCIMEEEIQKYAAQGANHIIASIEKNCPMSAICPWKARKDMIAAERVKRVSWSGLQVQEGDLLLIDEETGLDQYITTSFSMQDLSEMYEMLDTIRNYKLHEMEDAPREKILPMIKLYSTLEILLHTLLTIIIPAKQDAYLNHADFMGALVLNLASVGITSKDLKEIKHVSPSLSRLAREDYAFLFRNPKDGGDYEITAETLTEKQERFFKAANESPAQWAQMMRDYKPRFQIYNQFFTVSTKMKKLQELLTEPGCMLLFNPREKRVDIKIINKLYQAVITRTYSKRVQNRLEDGDDISKEDEKYLRLEETTSTIIADAAPVHSTLSSSGNIEYYATQVDIPNNVIVEQIIDFPNLPSSAPLPSRIRRSIMFDKMMSLRTEFKPEETGIIVCKQDLIDPEIKYIYEKYSAITGHWFVDNRGSNKFYEKGIKNLIVIGAPTPNRNAMRIEANALHIHHNVQLDESSTLTKRSISEDLAVVRSEDRHPFTREVMRLSEVSEIIQAFGRPRANRRPDALIRILFLSPTPIQAILPYPVNVTSVQEFVPVKELKDLVSEKTLKKARKAVEKLDLKRAELGASLFVDMRVSMESLIEQGYSDEDLIKKLLADYSELRDSKTLIPKVLDQLYGSQYKVPLNLTWTELSEEMQMLVFKKVLGGVSGRVQIAKDLEISPYVVQTAERRLSGMSTEEMKDLIDKLGDSEENEPVNDYSARKLDLGDDKIIGISGLDELFKGDPWSLNPNKEVLYLRESLPAYERLKEYLKRASRLQEEATEFRKMDTMPPMAVDIETFDPTHSNRILPGERDSMFNSAGPDAKRDTIRLISVRIGYKNLETLVFDLRYISRKFQVKIVEQLLKWKVWVGHNISFDLNFLMEKFPEIDKKAFSIMAHDTMIWDSILTPEYAPTDSNFRGIKRNLAVVVKDWLGKELLTKDMQLSNWDLDLLTRRQIAYSAMDVYIMPTLLRVMTMAYKQITQNRGDYDPVTVNIIEDLYKVSPEEAKKLLITTHPYPAPWMWIEGLFLPTLVESSRRGIRLDRTIVEDKIKKYTEIEFISGQAILKYMNVDHPVQLPPKTAKTGNSLFQEDRHFKATKTRGVQRATYIEALGYTLPRTDKNNPQATKDAVKTALGENHELYKLIVENESAQSRVTKLKELLKMMDKNNIIYPKFSQMASQTGRMSARKPAIMNVLPEVREAFIPREEGHTLIDTDFSQEELRVMAAISGDKVMLDAYHNGQDLHTLTAANLNGIHTSKVTREMRQSAKAANFGIIYGMGWRTFKEYALTNYDIAYTEEEARVVRNRFLSTYQGVKKLINQVYDMLQEKNCNEPQPKHLYTKNGFIVGYSRAGRGMVSKSPNDVLNFPVQGTGADILKLSAVKFKREIEAKGWNNDVYILNYVHDEILISCPEIIVEDVQELLKSSMERAASLLVTEVPIPVESNIGLTWADIH